MKVSVIMGVYHEKNMAQVQRAVESILNQTWTDLEFLIFQDGYDERTSKLLQKLAKEDSRILLMGENQNHGLAYALNRCIEVADGEYIARMDADDIAHTERLRKQIQFLEKHKEYDLVGCNARLIDKNGVWGERKMPLIPNEKDFLPYSPYVHPSVVFRSGVLKASGGYPESEDTKRLEDYEFFMRLHAQGIRGYNLQECLLYYREDRRAYKKKKYRYRLLECRVRYRGFQKLQIHGIKKWIYIAKPLVVGLIPTWAMEKAKMRKGKWELQNGKKVKTV